MKKNYLLIILPILAIICVIVDFSLKRNDSDKGNNEENKGDTTIQYLFDFDKYSGIKRSNVKRITINSYTIAGLEKQVIEDPTEVNRLFDSLNKLKIKEPTELACEDNTTIYEIELENGESYKVEIECDWVIIDTKRYIVE